MIKRSQPRFSMGFRGVRSAALAVVMALAACRSVSTPAPAVSPQATVAPAPVAVSDVPAASDAAAATCTGDREECLREAMPLLARALPEVARSPESAREALRASRSPAARAWAAYLAHRAGDEADARSIMESLAREGETPSLAPDEVTEPGARALYLAREHAELLGDDAVALMPCAVFAWDPEVARRAFAPLHGSTRDVIVAPFKQRCVREALDAAMGPAAGARVVAASEAVTRALFREFPRPEEGTMWTAVSIDAHEVLRDALLGIVPQADADAAARAVVARLAAEDPRSLPRVGSYRRSAEGHVTALANGICAVARMRGQSVTGGQCQRRAYSATLTAFTVWAGALRGM